MSIEMPKEHKPDATQLNIAFNNDDLKGSLEINPEYKKEESKETLQASTESKDDFNFSEEYGEKEDDPSDDLYRRFNKDRIPGYGVKKPGKSFPKPWENPLFDPYR